MAAVVWVGGTVFLVIVLVPAIRRPEFAGIASALIRFTALGFAGSAGFVLAYSFSPYREPRRPRHRLARSAAGRLLARLFRKHACHKADTRRRDSGDQRFS